MADVQDNDDSPKDGGKTPADSPVRNDNNRHRLTVGRDLLGLSFLLVLGSLALAVAFYPTAADVATVVGPITTLVGTLIGTIFGVQVTNQARNEAAATTQASVSGAVASALVTPGTPAADQVAIALANSTANGNPGVGGF